VISGWRRKMMTWPDRWGLGISEGRKKCVLVQGGNEDGSWAVFWAGLLCLPRPFLYFFCFVSFLYSDFYFSHIFFKFGPINSNKLVNFSKIQNNTVR
jgi:hypothetical protein